MSLGAYLGRIVVITIIVQLSFFCVAAIKQTDKFTDLAYGAYFVLLAIGAYLLVSEQYLTQAVVVLCVAVWGVRLSGYLFWRVLKMGRDRRFDGIREHFRSFMRFWLLQAIAICIISLPFLIVLYTASSEFHLIFRGGFVLWGIGVLLESIADRQKFQFKLHHPRRRIESGVWSKSRHPNYLGEMLVWWGVWIMSFSLIGPTYRWTIVSPLFVMYILLYVTGIPTVEAQHDKKYGDDPDYQAYKRSSNLLLPW